MKTLQLSRFAIALCACGLTGFSASAAAADERATNEALMRRIEALEQQVNAQKAAPAPAAVAPVAAAPAAPAATGDLKLSWGGYVKLDAIGSRFSDAAVAQGTGRDFYVPAAIPVTTAAAEHSRSYTDFLAKETRLFLKGEGTVLGHKLGSYVEFDFISGQISQATAGSGNEAVTNAYNPALRRAYITYDNLLLGQDWSTFQNLVALPDTLDFVAWPSEGTVFSRQPLIRYTHGNLAISLENTNTTVAARGTSAFGNTNDNTVPDLVSRYTLKTGFGDFTLAGMVRQLSDRGTVNNAGPVVAGNDTTIGYGLSLAGKIPTIGKDDIRFTVTGGDGIGRYQALNTIGDAVLDAQGHLHSVEIVNGFVAYRHPWNEQWRSTLTASAYHANTGKGTVAAGGTNFGPDATRSVRSSSINLLYSPIPKLTFGGELRYARRDTVAGNSGDLSRLQFSAKYSF